MPTIDGNFFEIQRRSVLYNTNTSMSAAQGGGTLGYNGDPNLVSVPPLGTPGQQLIYNCAMGSAYQYSDGTIYDKTALPNTWTVRASTGSQWLSGQVDVACLTTDIVGSPLSIREAPINGKWRVHTADPTDFAKMPAVGVLISKSTPTVGIAKILGVCEVFVGLTPGTNYMIGSGGVLVEEVPAVSVTGSFWGQHLGVAVSGNILMLSGNVNMIGYSI